MEDLVKFSKSQIKRAIDIYDNVALASSFGKDSMVLLHLARQVKPDIKVFSVMTRYKPPETLSFKEYVTSLWDLNIVTYQSDEEIPNELHKTDPHECCRILKVVPTMNAIKDLELKAWIAGLRRTEGVTRVNLQEVEHYENGIVKINPILDWTEADIWRYTALNHIPINPLYAKGYRSLGCLPCSSPYSETERGGRWVGTSKHGGECGIHSKMFKRIEQK
jgi:phosphoadenosine phosphosulfate reductase